MRERATEQNTCVHADVVSNPDYRPGMKKLVVAVAIAAGCGASGDTPSGDDVGSVDARGSGSGSGSGSATTTELTCTDFKRVDTAADGSRSEAVYKWAILDDVDPTSEYVATICYRPAQDPYNTPACPTGHTCTGAIVPGANTCFVQHLGVTRDGKLMISCGVVLTSYNASGGVVSTTDTTVLSVKITR